MARELKRWGENVIRQGLPRLSVVLQVFTACKIIAWAMRSLRPCSTVTSQSSVLRGFSSSSQFLRGWLVFDGRRPQVEVREPINEKKSVAPMKTRRRTIFTSGERHSLQFHAPRKGRSAKKRSVKKVLTPAPAAGEPQPLLSARGYGDPCAVEGRSDFREGDPAIEVGEVDQSEGKVNWRDPRRAN